jgi:hypothetical protein
MSAVNLGPNTRPRSSGWRCASPSPRRAARRPPSAPSTAPAPCRLAPTSACRRTTPIRPGGRSRARTAAARRPRPPCAAHCRGRSCPTGRAQQRIDRRRRGRHRSGVAISHDRPPSRSPAPRSSPSPSKAAAASRWSPSAPARPPASGIIASVIGPLIPARADRAPTSPHGPRARPPRPRCRGRRR